MRAPEQAGKIVWIVAEQLRQIRDAQRRVEVQADMLLHLGKQRGIGALLLTGRRRLHQNQTQKVIPRKRLGPGRARGVDQLAEIEGDPRALADVQRRRKPAPVPSREVRPVKGNVFAFRRSAVRTARREKKKRILRQGVLPLLLRKEDRAPRDKDQLGAFDRAGGVDPLPLGDKLPRALKTKPLVIQVGFFPQNYRFEGCNATVLPV